MQTTHAFNRVALAMSAVMLAATLLLMPGCEMAREIDAVIWHDVGPRPDPDDATKTITPPPAIVETIAAIAAALGFGGMTAWIRKTSKRTTNNEHAIADAMSALALRLDNLEAKKET